MTGLIVAIFPSRKILVRALDQVMADENFEVKRAAIVAKARSGETLILDDSLTPDEGGIAGGTLGAAMTVFGLFQLGALALPGVGPVVAVGAGALVGGLIGRATGRFASNLVDSGFHIEQVDQLAQRLVAGHPALILEFENVKEVLPLLREKLQDYRAELVEPLYKAATGTLTPPPELE